MSMPNLNTPAEINWRRSNMNKRDSVLVKSVEVLKDCRSLNAADEMNPMSRLVEKVPVRNEKRCTSSSIFLSLIVYATFGCPAEPFKTSYKQ